MHGFYGPGRVVRLQRVDVLTASSFEARGSPTTLGEPDAARHLEQRAWHPQLRAVDRLPSRARVPPAPLVWRSLRLTSCPGYHCCIPDRLLHTANKAGYATHPFHHPAGRDFRLHLRRLVSSTRSFASATNRFAVAHIYSPTLRRRRSLGRIYVFPWFHSVARGRISDSLAVGPTLLINQARTCILLRGICSLENRPQSWRVYMNMCSTRSRAGYRSKQRRVS